MITQLVKNFLMVLPGTESKYDSFFELTLVFKIMGTLSNYDFNIQIYCQILSSKFLNYKLKPFFSSEKYTFYINLGNSFNLQLTLPTWM